MRIIRVRDNETNRCNRNAKKTRARKDRKEQEGWGMYAGGGGVGGRSYNVRVRVKWFFCAFKLDFLQLICKASLIFKSNLELALSIILKQRELYESKPVAVEYGCSIKCLIDRSFNISNNRNSFHNDTENIKHNLVKNGYPPFLIDKVIKKYYDYKFSSNQNQKANLTFITLSYHISATFQTISK